MMGTVLSGQDCRHLRFFKPFHFLSKGGNVTQRDQNSKFASFLEHFPCYLPHQNDKTARIHASYDIISRYLSNRLSLNFTK